MGGPQYFGSKAINSIRVGLGLSSTVAVILGILMLCFTNAAAGLIGIFLGVSVIVSGLVYAGIGIFTRGLTVWSRILHVLLGIVMVIAGIIAIRHPALGLLALTFAIGFSWILEGVVTLSSIKFFGSAWGIVYGIISIIAGILLVVMPFSSSLTLIVFAGIALIVIGGVGLFRSFSVGRGL